MSQSPPLPPNEPSAPPPPPSQGGQSQNRTIMVILAYLGILALIPLLVEKDDKDVQWHAKYGIVLAVAWIALSVILTILTSIPGLGWILGCAVGPVLWIVILVVHIIAIVKAVNGERFRLPVLADFADKWQ